ncbi:MAG: hypothetical protein IT427_11720 [Pirellulales bacterium]|nr:hypothetical protein [Pirellulales bacterium]
MKRTEEAGMFLRRYQRRKYGKPHPYWALAESYRPAKGSRQWIVAYLGELTSDEQVGWARLGAHLNGEPQRRPKRSLFDPPKRDIRRDDEPLLVKLSSIRLEPTRDFGDAWLAWGLWRMLGLDCLLDEWIEPGANPCPGTQWQRFLRSPDSVNPRANGILPTPGIVARRSRNCWT